MKEVMRGCQAVCEAPMYFAGAGSPLDSGQLLPM